MRRAKASRWSGVLGLKLRAAGSDRRRPTAAYDKRARGGRDARRRAAASGYPPERAPEPGALGAGDIRSPA
ncbi:hypothetical protein DM52_2059 [Burkholderia mallei]|nr:hypothetical protein DM52_2059 [Burkholderia mallei]